MKTALVLTAVIVGLLLFVPAAGAEDPEGSDCDDLICPSQGTCILLRPGHIPPVAVDYEACLP